MLREPLRAACDPSRYAVFKESKLQLEWSGDHLSGATLNGRKFNVVKFDGPGEHPGATNFAMLRSEDGQRILKISNMTAYITDPESARQRLRKMVRAYNRGARIGGPTPDAYGIVNAIPTGKTGVRHYPFVEMESLATPDAIGTFKGLLHDDKAKLRDLLTRCNENHCVTANAADILIRAMEEKVSIADEFDFMIYPNRVRPLDVDEYQALSPQNFNRFLGTLSEFMLRMATVSGNNFAPHFMFLFRLRDQAAASTKLDPALKTKFFATLNRWIGLGEP